MENVRGSAWFERIIAASNAATAARRGSGETATRSRKVHANSSTWDGAATRSRSSSASSNAPRLSRSAIVSGAARRSWTSRQERMT
jgi:hypothetical protein